MKYHAIINKLPQGYPNSTIKPSSGITGLLRTALKENIFKDILNKCAANTTPTKHTHTNKNSVFNVSLN